MADVKFKKYCPRCDREFGASMELAALQAVADHVDKAHPDMENNIKEELQDEELD